MTTIVTIGLIQALFFAILALSKREKEFFDYYLAALFFILGIHLAINLIVFTDYRYSFPHLIGTGGPLAFLYGPLLFLFIKNYISPRHALKLADLWHFIPFLADYLFYAFSFYFKTGPEKIVAFDALSAGKPTLWLAMALMAQTISPVVYCFWSISILKAHRRNVRRLYSFTDNALKLEWLWYLTWSMLIVGAVALVLHSVIVLFDIADWIQLRMVIVSVAAFWVLTLGYYTVRKTSFYRSYPVPGMDTLIEEEGDKYEKTRLREEEIGPMKDKLTVYLREMRPYFNKNLTIGELAEAIDIPAYQLSQLINGTLGQTFFELINTLRVEEIKTRFFDPQYSRFTLPGIAMDCGFNSKASFNRIFKQITGQTPTEFIRMKKAA